MNVINDIAQNNNIQVGYYNREKILRIFWLIDQVTPEVNNFLRKRLISVNFIIKQLFDILGVEYKIIPLTQSKIHYDIMKIGGRGFIPRLRPILTVWFLRIWTRSRESPPLLIDRETLGKRLYLGLTYIEYYPD